MHNDMKSLNYLVDQGRVMLSDFGSASTLPAMSPEQVAQTPTTYASPEWGSEQGLNQQSDLYQLGMMIHLMNGGEMPGRGEFLAPDPDQPAVGAVNRLRDALVDPAPGNRPSLDAVLQSSYFQDLQVHDQQKVADLVAKAEAYGVKVGKRIGKINDNIINLEFDIKLLNNRLKNTDDPDKSARLSADKAVLNEQLKALQAQKAQLHQDPEIAGLARELKQMSQGFA
jgi:serine/threonine protein kinase